MQIDGRVDALESAGFQHRKYANDHTLKLAVGQKGRSSLKSSEGLHHMQSVQVMLLEIASLAYDQS